MHQRWYWSKSKILSIYTYVINFCGFVENKSLKSITGETAKHNRALNFLIWKIYTPLRIIYWKLDKQEFRQHLKM